MRKKSKVLIAFGFCLCMVLVLIPCFSLPISAADGKPEGMSDEMWKWSQNAPTYFFTTNDYGGWVMIDYEINTGLYRRVYIAFPGGSVSQNTFKIRFDGDEHEGSATSTVNGSIWYTKYHSETAGTYSYSGTDLNKINISWGRNVKAYIYAYNVGLQFDSNIVTSPELYSSLNYTFKGAVYGKQGYPFQWDSFKYKTVIRSTNFEGNYNYPYMYLCYNWEKGYVGLGTNPTQAEAPLAYGIFPEGNIANEKGRYTIVYSYSMEGNVTSSYIDPSIFYLTNYVRYKPLPLVLYSNFPVLLEDGTWIEPTNPVNGTWDGPEIDSGSQSELEDLESDLLSSSQIDMSVLDDALNFDKSGIPLVGQFMTSVIDLGFGSIVVFCLSFGLGLAILGKRFG